MAGDDELDIDEIRERAERVFRHRAPGQSIGGLDKRDAMKVLEDVPALCDEVERMREQNARLRDRLHILADNIATRGADSDPDAIIDRVVEARESRDDRKHERKRLYIDREQDDEQ